MMTNVNNRSLKKIEKLLVSSQSVFTTQDLAVIWGVGDKVSLYANIQYYVETGKLQRVYKGIYAIKNYTSFELAQKIITPSYISLQSALVFHKITFQFFMSVRSMSLISKSVRVGQKKFVYHRLKERVFYDSLGIESRGNYQIASPERAICDTLYLFSKHPFDNLKPIDIDLLSKVSKIYHNQRLEEEVKKLIDKERLHV